MHLIKTIIASFTAASIANPLFAVEDCTFAHTMRYINASKFHQTEDLGQVSIHLMFETNAQLFRRSKSGPAIYELAEKVEYTEDGRTMRIKMREDCGWSDGVPITVAEMVEGLRNVFTVDPDLYVPGKSFFANGYEFAEWKADPDKVGIRIGADETIEIDINVGGDLVEQILTRYNFAPFPLHLSPEEQDKWSEGDLRRISSGPYVANFYDASQIKMERNPYFCQGIQPQIENIHVINSTKASEQIGLFFNGAINVAERFAARDFEALQQREGVMNLESYKERDMNDEILDYLVEAGGSILEEHPEIRPLLHQAIDGNLLNSVTGGAAFENFSLSYPYENYEIMPDEIFSKSYPERLENARLKMEELGYSSANPFNITIALREGFNNQQMANALVGMWSQIHVSANVIIIPRGSRDLANLEGGIYRDYIVLAIGSDYSDPSDFLSSIIQYGKFENLEEIQDQIVETFTIRDQKKRWEALAKIDREILQTRRILPVSVVKTPWILSNDLELGDRFYLTASNLSSSTCEM